MPFQNVLNNRSLPNPNVHLSTKPKCLMYVKIRTTKCFPIFKFIDVHNISTYLPTKQGTRKIQFSGLFLDSFKYNTQFSWGRLTTIIYSLGT